MTKFAFVAIVGRPSVGKSTLLNKMCGQKVAIVSKVPQTTRNAIRGIVNRERGQLVFIDTPGRHVSEKKFNKKLQEVSDHAIEDCDLILYIIDATRPPGVEEEEIIQKIKEQREKRKELKIITAVNKIDLSASASLREDHFPISAQTGQGIEELIDALYALAPEGEPQYDTEYYTDQDVSFRVAEIIREQAINRLRQELPHSIYVEIADLELKEQENVLWCRSFIIVERESQKGMVVGKGGEMIKAIRLAALKELKNIFDWKIDLDLRVKTDSNWKKKF